MPWAKFDDRFPSNRKIALLSDRAFRLYVTAVCWSAENSTDGVIEREELRLIASYRGVNRAVTELIERGLWIATDDGWCIHDFLDYNPSREQVLVARKTNAARQERFRQRKNGTPSPPEGRSDHPEDTPRNGASNGVRNGVTNAAPARPDPNPPTGGEGRCASTGSSGRASERAHTPIPATFKPSSDSREWARAEGHLDRLGGPTALADVTAAFLDWHAGKGTLAADPDALWRKWVREQHVAPRAEPGGAVVVPLHAGHRSSGTDGRLGEHAALIAELEAKEARS